MDRKEKDKEGEQKRKPSHDENDDEKVDRYEIERGNEPHREDEFPDDKEDQTR
jgi:hypothetical protein